MSALSLAEAKAFLPNAPASDDALIQSLIDAAEDLVSRYIGSPVGPTVQTERHRPTRTIVLRQSRVVGAAITVTDDAGVAVTGYTLEPGPLLVRYDTFGFSYGFSYGRFTVTYTAGFSPLPSALRLAILYTVQHAYESQQGAVPVSFQSGADETFVASRGFAMPNRAKEYLEPYRREQALA